MVTVTQDPTNPDRLTLTSTVTVYLDKYLLDTLSSEITSAIRDQAQRDLRSSPSVKEAISKAATAKLLSMLGVDPAPLPTPEEPE